MSDVTDFHRRIFFHCSFAPEKGFTLIEVLISMFVFALIVSMVTMSLSGTFKVIEASDSQGIFYHRAQVAMLRISEDIASALPRQKTAFKGEERTVDGRRADYLSFVSNAHLQFSVDLPSQPEKENEDNHERVPEKPPRRALITYEVRSGGENEGELVLVRSDDPHYNRNPASSTIGEENKGYILCDHLYSVRFTYFNHNGEEIDTWDVNDEGTGPNKIPKTVTCTLEFVIDFDKEETLEFSTEIFLPAGI